MTRLYARLVVALGWLVVPAVAVAAFFAWHSLPGLSALPESGVNALLPQDTDAARAERQAGELFGSALLPRIAVVQRNPRGLTVAQQRRIVKTAVLLDRDALPGYPAGSRALPYLNTFRLIRGSREQGTAAITYLGFPGSLSPRQQNALAAHYAEAVSVPGARAHATGFLPGSIEQSNEIDGGLLWVELATILLIAVIIGLYLRSVVAPLVTLGAAGVAYLIAIHTMSYLGARLGLHVQHEVEPIVVVLLLAVVTDYSVFFLSGMLGRLREGEPPRAAARRATAEVLPIVLTAGLIIAAGLATLWIAGIDFVHALGPALALIVLVSLAVSVLFVPAAMGILGRRMFWPGLRGEQTGAEPTAGVGDSIRRAVAHGTSRKLGAVPTLVVTIAALAIAAVGLVHLHLALTPVRGLSSDAPAATAARAAGKGFTPGIIAPTELVLRDPGIGNRQVALKRFGRALRARPEVAAVIGAALPVLPKRAQVAFRSPDGGAVRYFIALRHHPYSSAGIDDIRRLEGAVPGLLDGAGLPRAQPSFAGDTALAAETTHLVGHDLLYVGLAAMFVNILLLAAFLRSLVAPVLLVGASMLGIAATLGLTSLFQRVVLGAPDMTYYVPLAVGVLLLSLGTDYNLFIVGRIWQEADRRDLPAAIRAAVPRASRAISIAALALAASFATLAIIPIDPFRSLAFAVCTGVIIDAFLVRTLMIPALLVVAGDWSWWPSRREARASAPV
ncbi:MAG TPA: MMPL family transporter [Gaiellaceae bacterium]|nr:MMPL family transporter [Gaiellaceae bacterium]